MHNAPGARLRNEFATADYLHRTDLHRQIWGTGNDAHYACSYLISRYLHQPSKQSSASVFSLHTTARTYHTQSSLRKRTTERNTTKRSLNETDDDN